MERESYYERGTLAMNALRGLLQGQFIFRFEDGKRYLYRHVSRDT